MDWGAVGAGGSAHGTGGAAVHVVPDYGLIGNEGGRIGRGDAATFGGHANAAASAHGLQLASGSFMVTSVGTAAGIATPVLPAPGGAVVGSLTTAEGAVGSLTTAEGAVGTLG